MDEDSEVEEPSRLRIRSVVPFRLSIPGRPEDLELLRQQDWVKIVGDVAGDWQLTSDNVTAAAWESQALFRHCERGRLHELNGLLGAAGERLALASAAVIETEV